MTHHFLYFFSCYFVLPALIHITFLTQAISDINDDSNIHKNHSHPKPDQTTPLPFEFRILPPFSGDFDPKTDPLEPGQLISHLNRPTHVFLTIYKNLYSIAFFYGLIKARQLK